MADIKTVIASALNEISVMGTLELAMDGAETVEALGRPIGNDVEVLVVVRPAHAPVSPMRDAA